MAEVADGLGTGVAKGFLELESEEDMRVRGGKVAEERY
jgi:hypothetical protein